jgi:hypothetical protein
MVFVKVENIDDLYIMENRNFKITLGKSGCVESFVVKKNNIELVNFKDNCCDRIASVDKETDLSKMEYYVTDRSSAVSYQTDCDFYNFRKVYSATDNAFIIDIYIQSKSSLKYSYLCDFYSKKMSYFMIGDKKYQNSKKNIQTEADNLLLVDDISDIYLGAIFKDALLSIEDRESSLNLYFKHNFRINSNELYHIFYKFALV